MGYQSGSLLNLLLLLPMWGYPVLFVLTFRGQCRSVGSSIAESECRSHIQAELLLSPLSPGADQDDHSRSESATGVLKLMNEWQHECFRKSHNDEIY